MLKTIIENRKESVYSVAKGSGIPYTTLNELVNEKKQIGDCSIKTISKLSKYLGISMDAMCAGETGCEEVQTAHTWEDNRKKTFVFPIIQASDSYDASRIYPLKQRLVYRLSKEVFSDERISSVKLFGSSTNIRCTKKSDIDLAVELDPSSLNNQTKNEISEKIQEISNWNADIIWLDRVEVGSKLYNNIERGVLLK